jgi:dihydrodipicolinate synthase/N-acetylneuraminate lyase
VSSTSGEVGPVIPACWSHLLPRKLCPMGSTVEVSMSRTFRGVFTIPSTPFDERLNVDWDALKRVVDFCVGCGAHGIVWPVNASGFATLSDEERLKGAELVIAQVGGRVPVVIGTQGVCASHAAMFSRHASDAGADAVIAMAPYIQKVQGEPALLDYYRAISEAADLSVFVQNHGRGSALSVPTLTCLIQEVDHIEYVKEETSPATHKLTQVREAAGPKLRGVFGGAGGRYLLLEHPRGVAGQMPGCHVTDVVVRLWDALEAGSLQEAKRVFGLMAPLFAIEEQCPGAIYKEVLRRRGVINLAHSRGASADIMDEQDHFALDGILADLEPLFTWHS